MDNTPSYGQRLCYKPDRYGRPTRLISSCSAAVRMLSFMTLGVNVAETMGRTLPSAGRVGSPGSVVHAQSLILRGARRTARLAKPAGRCRDPARGNAADGLEQLELVCRQGDGRRYPSGRGPDRLDGDARRRLCLRQHRRQLGGQARCRGRDPPERKVPGHEGARGLRALEGTEARPLFIAGPADLRRVRRLLRP